MVRMLEILGYEELHPKLGGLLACYKFGGGGPKVGPALSPIPRRVEVDVAAAEREERVLSSNRRGRASFRQRNRGDTSGSSVFETELLGT